MFSAHHPRPGMWRRVVRTFGSSCLQAPHEGPSATCCRAVLRHCRWAGRSQTAKPTIHDLAWEAVITELKISFDGEDSLLAVYDL
jgi:hypothetical protein